MPSGIAVREVDTPVEKDERFRPEAAPGSEQVPYQPRFRVVTRKPLAPAAPVRVSPTHRASFLAAFPALCLLVYVLFWTLAIRGGYYRDQLQGRIGQLRVEQAELQAEKLLLQSPGHILERARNELGMQAALDTEYARISTPRTLAREPQPAGSEVQQAMKGSAGNLTR